MLLLAVGAFAVQGSMQQPGQVPQPGAASPNAQQPGNMPPSNAPQTPPGSTQNPQAEPSQPPMRSGPPSIDDQVATLAERLNLTSDQQTKVKSILEDQHQQAVAVVGDTSLSQNDKMQKIMGLREATISKVRSTLTSDDQKQKFDAMVQTQNDRMRERQQQQPQSDNPPPQSSNPSPK
jgi:hypothetical protein